MKQKNLLKIVALSAVALSSLGLSLHTGDQAQAAGVGKIVNPDGDSSVYVYDAPNGNLITNRTLANGSSWKIGQTVQVSGHGTWYEIGANVWINNYMMQVTSTTDPSTDANTNANTDNTTTNDTTSDANTTTKVATVKNPNGTANVYAYSSPAGETIGDPTYAVGSQWKITKTVSVSGHGNWYRIGQNIWLNDYVTDVSEVGSTENPTENTQKAITVTESTPVYNQINGAATGQVLDANTSWAYFETKVDNGATWYQVGKDQWIQQGNSSEVNAGAASGVATINANGAGVYTAPNSGSVTKTLGTGSQWAVSGATTVDGVLWYQVGKNQWISSANVTDKSTITTDQDSTADNNANQSGQVITLTEAAPIYDGPMTNGGSLNGDLLAAGTAWKVNDVQTYNGTNWGLVGQNQWINLSLGKLN